MTFTLYAFNYLKISLLTLLLLLNSYASEFSASVSNYSLNILRQFTLMVFGNVLMLLLMDAAFAAVTVLLSNN